MLRITVFLLSWAACAMAPASALACGESMFRVGFGMIVPAARTAQPANIAIFKAADVDPDVFFDDGKISRRLAGAGHQVARVDGKQAAGSDGRRFDFVIVRAAEQDRARAALGDRVDKAIFLPVYEGFGGGDDTASLGLPSNATLRQIMDTLQRALQPAH